MKEYIKALSAMNDLILNDSISSKEIDEFSKSDYKWATHRKENKKKFFQPKKGKIYQFDFGKNYIPEMSYEHRGMIIGVKQRLLYVLPIFSYMPKHEKEIYDPTENPKGNLFLLKSSIYSFLDHDSVMKLNDIRTVSMDRVLYHQKDNVGIKNETYDTIIKLVFEKYFPEINFELKQTQEEMEKLKKEIEDLQLRVSQLEKEFIEIKSKQSGTEKDKSFPDS